MSVGFHLQSNCCGNGITNNHTMFYQQDDDDVFNNDILVQELANQISMFHLPNDQQQQQQQAIIEPDLGVIGYGYLSDDQSSGVGSSSGGSRRHNSLNITESVEVPSSEHVAEIVGRQGCKIKNLRAKTNTYIKTPVRGESSVFVVTGRPEDVAHATQVIRSAAEHFTQIRQSRKHCQGTALPGQVTINVRVPYRVVGLVVGPKGATIKRIQQQTHTYIITPSRDSEPVFQVTGESSNVGAAKAEIESYILARTGKQPAEYQTGHMMMTTTVINESCDSGLFCGLRQQQQDNNTFMNNKIWSTTTDYAISSMPMCIPTAFAQASPPPSDSGFCGSHSDEHDDQCNNMTSNTAMLYNMNQWSTLSYDQQKTPTTTTTFCNQNEVDDANYSSPITLLGTQLWQQLDNSGSNRQSKFGW